MVVARDRGLRATASCEVRYPRFITGQGWERKAPGLQVKDSR